MKLFACTFPLWPDYLRILTRYQGTTHWMQHLLLCHSRRLEQDFLVALRIAITQEKVCIISKTDAP
jgi:hypothetical protein